MADELRRRSGRGREVGPVTVTPCNGRGLRRLSGSWALMRRSPPPQLGSTIANASADTNRHSFPVMGPRTCSKLEMGPRSRIASAEGALPSDEAQLL